MIEAIAAVEKAMAQGDQAQARAVLRQFDPSAERDANLLGRAAGMALQIGDAALAERIAARFVAVAPDFAGSHHAYGLALAMVGQLEAAQASLERALALAPAAPMVWLHLGGVKLQRNDRDGAFAAYDRCVAMNPDWRDARIGRGLARLRAFRAEQAIADFEWWTRHEPASPDAWRGLAEACELDGRYDDAVTARERELSVRPDDLSRLREAGLAFARMGLTSRARETLARPVANDPSDLRARWARWQMMPLMYRDESEVAAWRQRWIDDLGEFEKLDPADFTHEQITEALLVHSAFFMHYQGGDVTELMRRYGALVTRFARHAFPGEYARPTSRSDDKLRVGFASAYFRKHTVRGLFHRWLAELDRTAHVVVAIHLGGVSDEATEALPDIADEVIRGHATNEAWVEALKSADLDVLIWLDIGMDSLTQMLASLRFAPVTAMAWGHPITSGYEAVDAFLSSDLMEPEHGDAHYTEKLVRLPNLSISFPLPDRAAKARIPYDGSRPLRLVCAQSVFKLGPDNQALFVQLAQRLPDAELHFIPHPSPAVRKDFEALLREKFAAAGVQFDGRVRLHPALKHDVFFQLLEYADVFVDTLGWSGGHTTLEALSTDLPLVTLPGEFMRARHTYAMVRRLELESDLVAQDVDDYAAKVAALAVPETHARIVDAIRARKSKLYFDSESVRGLERWIAEATRAT